MKKYGLDRALGKGKSTKNLYVLMGLAIVQHKPVAEDDQEGRTVPKTRLWKSARKYLSSIEVFRRDVLACPYRSQAREWGGGWIVFCTLRSLHNLHMSF